MRCVFCGNDADVVTVVPVPDGSGVETSCIDCATERGIYCGKHNAPHTGFAERPQDPSCKKNSACLQCIEDDVRAHAKDAVPICIKIMDALPHDEWARVELWSSIVRAVKPGDTTAICILRSLLVGVHRGVAANLPDAVERVTKSRVADDIVPFPF